MNPGENIPGATVTGNTVVNGYTVPVDLAVSSRAGTLPSEYVASANVEFSGEFESTVSDEFVAYISDPGYAGTGNLGAGLSGSGGSYRYGFNGKENDNEVNGVGNQQDYGARIYDPRLGRWLSVDPMRQLSPDITPYCFGYNNPIRYKDPDGAWEEDGHYWTVYALGIAMGMKKETAQLIASNAVYYDHHVHSNNTMSLHISHNNPFIGKIFGIGTWADKNLQKSWHALTGGSQSEALSKAINRVLMGDYDQLHTVGDSWAHSYINCRS